MSARRLPLPGDWHTHAPGRTAEDLSAHYGCCVRTIQRWRREAPAGRTSRGPDRYPRVARLSA